MPERVAWRSYVLGLFILFQLVYLPAANFIKLIPLRLPESNGELDDDITAKDAWLFAPLTSRTTKSRSVSMAACTTRKSTGRHRGSPVAWVFRCGSR